MIAQLWFAKLHLNKTQYFWSNVLWTHKFTYKLVEELEN